MALTDDAIEKIKLMILGGELAPGDRLPPEKELSERLGLSRSSLREAIKALDVARVLDVRRGDGTYVTSLQPAVLLEATSFLVDVFDAEGLLEIFQVRRMLEPQATRNACERMSPQTMLRLRELLTEVSESTPVAELVEHDMLFHRTIIEQTGNSYLTSLLDGLSNHTLRARIWRGLTESNAVALTLAEHAAILDAIEQGDCALAEALAMVHISGVEEWLRGSLERRDDHTIALE